MTTSARLLKCVLVVMSILPFSLVRAQSPQAYKDHYNVALFLYQGVELLDFAGPGEVFGSTSGFNVYTVSVDRKELVSQGFVHIKPAYSLQDAPSPDIIIFPGGNSGPTANTPQVLAWLKARAAAGAFLMSVCTGASILGKAGVLDGLKVTTWHGYIQSLQAMLPQTRVLQNTRFVDSGRIMTTAGVSAGIDGALHLVSRIKGLEVARATARYMEYDKWRPEEGQVDYPKVSLDQVEASRAGTAVMNTTSLPYEGELKNLAAELGEQGQYPQAAQVLEATVQRYPYSTAYQQLGQVYRQLGTKAPLAGTSFLKLLQEGRIDEAVAVYQQTEKAFPGWKLLPEHDINRLGYGLLNQQAYGDAVKVLQLNAWAYPQSSNAFDSLGEALMKSGNRKEAVANYRQSLKLNPANENAKKMLAELEGKSYN